MEGGRREKERGGGRRGEVKGEGSERREQDAEKGDRGGRMKELTEGEGWTFEARRGDRG